MYSNNNTKQNESDTMLIACPYVCRRYPNCHSLDTVVLFFTARPALYKPTRFM